MRTVTHNSDRNKSRGETQKQTQVYHHHQHKIAAIKFDVVVYNKKNRFIHSHIAILCCFTYESQN